MSTRGTRSSTNGFVLAGGKSTRMGRDKALLAWHGRTLLEHMIDLISSATDFVRVIGRDEFPDLIAGQGPLGGILTALHVSETDANLVVAVDLPLLTPDFLKYFQERLEKSLRAIVACRIEDRYPLCLGVRTSLLPRIQNRVEEGRLSIQSLIEDNEPDLILEPELTRCGFTPHIFKNINTQTDFRGLP